MRLEEGVWVWVSEREREGGREGERREGGREGERERLRVCASRRLALHIHMQISCEAARQTSASTSR